VETLETFSQIFDTASAHLFDSWTDKDLYRAIDNPERPGDEAEIAEYVEELKKRQAERERLAQRSAEIRKQHNIPEPTDPS
jgi:hypothetical protein